MKRVLFLVIPILLSACDSSYSVEDFKKDEKLSSQWRAKCAKATNPSDTVVDNCNNVTKSDYQSFQEKMKKNGGRF